MPKYKKRRVLSVAVAVLFLLSGVAYQAWQNRSDFSDQSVQSAHTIPQTEAPPTGSASAALDNLTVKGKAPKTGYKRDQFSAGWADAGQCDVRNVVMKRDMSGVITRSETDCTVMQGTLIDPYTAVAIPFVRGSDNSKIQIDHVVALSNAWQTGAQQISSDDRFRFANDPLNLLAVDGPTNQKKGDADAATWLPPNKAYRCSYVARQIAVKQKYHLWVVDAEKDAMKRVLQDCPDQQLPVVNN